jgi:hypothetical protein
MNRIKRSHSLYIQGYQLVWGDMRIEAATVTQITKWHDSHLLTGRTPQGKLLVLDPVLMPHRSCTYNCRCLDWYKGILNCSDDCNTQNYWGFGLLPSSGVLVSRNTTFRKLDQWLILALSKRLNWIGVFSHLSPENGHRSSFRNVVFLLTRAPDDGESPKLR